MSKSLYKIIDAVPLEVLIGISATLVAILIPLSLFLMESLNFSKQLGFLSWDNRVIFNQVLKVKILFIFLLLTVFPLVFWNFEVLRGLAFLLCIVGYFGTIKAMYRAYQWIMSKSTDGYSWIGQFEKERMTYRNKLRSEYLDSLKSDDEILEVWETIFKTQGWIGIDPKLFTEKYVQAVQQVERNADEMKEKLKNSDSNFEVYQYESVLINFLINSLEGKYNDSKFVFETLYSFSPLQKFVFNRYAKTLDTHDMNFNIRYLLEYLMKYVNSHEFYGFGGKNYDSSSDSFNQDFYEMLKKLQKQDEENQKEIPRVKEILSYFGNTFFDTLDYQKLKYGGHNFNFPDEWRITSENIKSDIIVQDWYNVFLEYFLEHRKSVNKYPDTPEESSRLLAITNYFLPKISGKKFSEVLELRYFTNGQVISEPEVIWETILKYPEYNLLEYNINEKDTKEVFEILYLVCHNFLESDQINTYKNNLSEIKVSDNTKEYFRKRELLELFDELLEWQRYRKESNGGQ